MVKSPGRKRPAAGSAPYLLPKQEDLPDQARANWRRECNARVPEQASEPADHVQASVPAFRAKAVTQEK